MGRSLRLILALASTVVWGASQAAEEPVAAPATVAAEAAPAAAASATQAETGASPGTARAAAHGHHMARHSPDEILDERVAALGKALGLDAGQKTEVRKILVLQRDQLRQAWSDPARTSADRIGVSNSINKQTEDRIRSILTETQREQYIASKPASAEGGQHEHGLDYWMDQMQGKH